VFASVGLLLIHWKPMRFCRFKSNDDKIGQREGIEARDADQQQQG
jgi:hypothetical protein